jgi:prepilin-type N-terminal cleavage/methylation domain-containing protein
MSSLPFSRVSDRSHARPRAFTLPELLVVIAILSMLTGALVPALNSAGRSALLTHEGNRVAALAELARQEALGKNAMTALVMDAKDGSVGEPEWFFSIWQLDMNDAGTPEWRRISRTEKLREGILVDESIIETENTASALAGLEGDCKWVFLPGGNLLGTKWGQLTFTQKGSGNSYTLTLLNATGRTKVTRN